MDQKYYLRALDSKDKDYLLKWNRDDEIRNLTGALFPASYLEHERWFESKALSTTEKMWLIVSANNDEPIGTVGLKNLDYINSNVEIFIYIGEKDYWGKGIGSQVISEIVDFAYNTLNFHKVYLYVFEYNKRAINMYEKIGFSVEGELIDSLYRNGQFYNKFIMGKIRGKLI
ncbi:GNAT family N-acetyltransferase [Psychrobacillus sp. BM2]|uniref:GNAT family N-acetyltransferase n=1 Tax=Psychrobacillus sp. BM2 TaxID=3400421 RepID=UPI003B023BF3